MGVLVLFCSQINTQAQTIGDSIGISLDSGVVVVDTTLKTEHDVIVQNENGEKTFFAGGEGSQYEGKVGVGTDNPDDKLQVYDAQRASMSVTTGTNADMGLKIGVATTADQYRKGSIAGEIITGNILCHNDLQVSGNATISGNTSLNGVSTFSSSTTNPVYIKTSHTVDYGYNLFLTTARDKTKAIGLGVHNGSTYKENFVVYGDGFVKARDIIVSNLNPFPDYVFDKNYCRLSLTELETYIQQNKHLPNMPTAEHIAKNGASIGEFTSKLTEKIEELTLYQIELQKQIEAVMLQNKQLQYEVDKLKTKK